LKCHFIFWWGVLFDRFFRHASRSLPATNNV
jgi:hypothetical protein